jgi:hypothetical protein
MQHREQGEGESPSLPKYSALHEQAFYVPPAQPYLVPPQSYQHQGYAPIPVIPAGFIPPVPIPISSVAQKNSIYDSGCVTGCCMSWLFGIFAAVCMQMQTTESGKLGYMKGMGIMAMITGIAVAITGFILNSNNYCWTNSYYYRECTFPEELWIILLGFGLGYAMIGVFLIYRASQKFHDICNDPYVSA